MHIGIDISSLTYERGVSRYTANLIRALLQQKNIYLSMYGVSMRQYDFLKSKAQNLLKYKKFNNKANFKLQKIPPSLLEWLWHWNFNPISKQLPKIDVFHSWDWLQPPDKNLPLVSTIHDLAILKFPKNAHPKIVKAHQRSLEILKQRQAQIIAVSQSTKKDILNILQIPSWQVTVIHEALPVEVEEMGEFLSNHEEEYQSIKNSLHLEKPFLFFVGTREPRKNLLRLIQAWEPLKNDYQLIIAGDAGWDETSLKDKTLPANLQKLLQNAQLRFLGRVTDSELAVLYSEAQMFVYPSLYEGFGLPILEAFYHGTPVVTSNVSSMVEVAGNAACLVEPESVESIRAGITTILNENMAEQQKRLQRMVIRKQMFNWQKVAEKTLEVYQKALER